MGWTTLKISPGLVRNVTRYAASGTWFDGSLVRFRDGAPEKWAGWIDGYSGFTMQGMCRSLHRHGTLDKIRWVSAGTSKRFYMLRNEFQYDVTPVTTAVPVALTADPLATTNASTLVTVTHASHGQFPGDSVVIAGSAAVGGVPAIDINKEHEITSWVDDNHYTITVATAATSTVAAGGGGVVTVQYVFAAGTDDVIVAASGWGTGAWGEGVWGGAIGATASGADQMGIWTQDNWGEDLVANANGGPIFYWLASAPADRMIDILDIAGGYLGPGSDAADGHAPAESQFIIVSHRDRHLLAFGCTVFGGTAVEPMTFRWCNQEAITNWNDADTNGTAGSLPLSNGSKFISAIATAREILAWTDQAMYSIQYVGFPLIYSAELLERWSDICGLKARCSFNGVVYWMGSGGFYSYAGRTDKLACPIWDYISTRLNRQQMAKVYASSNQNHNEVIFFYPSNSSGNVEVDSYVAFDVVQGIWMFGELPRTAWMDLDALSPVVAASPPITVDSVVYQPKLLEHDNGTDDGLTGISRPISAFIESGPIELSAEGSYDKGDRIMFVKRIMPDVTFRDITTSSSAPQMRIVLKMMDKPGGGFDENSSSQVRRSVTIPVEQFTEETFVRLRGRSLTIRAESNTIGTNWRLGFTRIYARTDGQR